jgi:hypothetical protein
MVYGYAPAVAVVTRLVRPVLAYAHLQGIRTSMFVDDGQVSRETKEETEEAARLLWDLFQMAGWNIQWKKTTKAAEQKVRYLGVEVDCKDMVYRLPEDKLVDIEAGLDRELAKGRCGKQTEVREAAEVLGKLAACKLTHGRTIHMLTRKAQQQLGDVTQQGGWDVRMKWTPEAVQELEDVRKHLRFLNGKNIRREDGPEMCYTKEDTERYKSKVAQHGQGYSKTEDPKRCSYVVTAKTEVIQVVDGVQGQTDKVEEGIREMRAAWHALREDKARMQRIAGGRVFWKTTSMIGYKFLKVGARTEEAKEWGLRLGVAEKEAKVDLVPVWVGPPRGGQLADRGPGSSTDEWGIEDEWLQPVLDRFQVEITVDGFASAKNAKCSRFFS